MKKKLSLKFNFEKIKTQINLFRNIQKFIFIYLIKKYVFCNQLFKYTKEKLKIQKK